MTAGCLAGDHERNTEYPLGCDYLALSWRCVIHIRADRKARELQHAPVDRKRRARRAEIANESAGEHFYLPLPASATRSSEGSSLRSCR